MKKLFTLVALSFLLTSCAPSPKVTQQEIDTMKQICNEGRREFTVSQYGDLVYCGSSIPTPKDNIDKCINKYIESVDEKYNNPDTVSNLREDNYSQVVKTCNETFGSLSGSVEK